MNVIALWRKYIADEIPPESYMTNGPWIDYGELLRRYECLDEEFEAYSDIADALPIPDSDVIDTYYREHLNGADHTVELSTLITVLSMPVTAYLVETSKDAHSRSGFSEDSSSSS